jgi:hypothetical protein
MEIVDFTKWFLSIFKNNDKEATIAFEVISSVFGKYQRPVTKLDQKINYKGKDVLVAEYINNFYLVVQDNIILQNSNIPDINNFFIPDEMKDYIYYENSGKIVLKNRYIDFNQLLHNIMGKIDMNRFYFLAVGAFHEKFPDSAHLNTLFFFRDTSGILIFHYEPHGISKSPDIRIYTDLVNNLAQGIKENIHEKYGKITIVDKEISCPYGLQTKSLEPYGYCIMFNTLWTYILYEILKKESNGELSNDVVKNIVKNIEPMILRHPFVKNRKNLLLIMINLSLDIIEHYIKLPIYKEYHSVIEQDLDKDFNIKSKKQATLKNVSHINKTGLSNYEKRFDNESCNSEDDCYSGCCIHKKCVDSSRCMTKEE